MPQRGARRHRETRRLLAPPTVNRGSFACVCREPGTRAHCTIAHGPPLRSSGDLRHVFGSSLEGRLRVAWVEWFSDGPVN